MSKKMKFVEIDDLPKISNKELVISLLEIVYNIDWKILQVFKACLFRLYHDIEIEFSIIELFDLMQHSDHNKNIIKNKISNKNEIKFSIIELCDLENLHHNKDIIKNKLSNKNEIEILLEFNFAKERSKIMEEEKVKLIETIDNDDFVDDIEYKNKILEYAKSIDWKLWEILQILQRQEKNSLSPTNQDEEATLDDIFNIKENKEE